MSITFPVDDVEPATERAPVTPLGAHLGAYLHLGYAGATEVLPTRDIHSLLAAVHRAFAEHRPLVLSPDVVWLTIAQGVAQHVRLHAEALRPRLVRHAGRKRLEIMRAALPEGEAWAEVITDFRALVADEIGDGLPRLLTCDFSTSGPIERTASEIVLMDTLAPYFDYVVSLICGIPTITLTGTPADWRAIRARLDVIAELDLGWWTASLVPIADRLVDAAEGRADRAFFARIYKPQHAYGWDMIAGWIARLFPYTGVSGVYEERNPLLAFELDAALPASGESYYTGPGIYAHSAPRGISQVPVWLEFEGNRSLVFVEGGVLAVEQDDAGALVPRCGYLVRDGGAPVLAVIDRLRRDHVATPGTDARAWASDSALRRLFAEIGSATLFDGAWRLLPPERRDSIHLYPRDGRYTTAVRIVDLADGTLLALALDLDERSRVVVRLRADHLEPAPPPVDGEIDVSDQPYGEAAARWRTRERVEDIPIVGESLIEVLAHALDSGGALATRGALFERARYYWDSPTHAAPLLERLRRAHRIVLGEAQHWRLFGVVVEGVLRIGEVTWAVHPGRRDRVVLIANDHIRWMIELSDGTALGVVSGSPRGSTDQCIVQLRLDALSPAPTPPRRKGGPLRFVTSEDATSIPVVGRTFVEVISHALDHGCVPAPTGTLAQWQA
ncbi:MAG: DUF4419 domain-containing protein [Deltaproteobacteria bacterium]|nr:DUF4419 domain-containing protein [Deltaproteobacteria bacterium]